MPVPTLLSSAMRFDSSVESVLMAWRLMSFFLGRGTLSGKRGSMPQFDSESSSSDGRLWTVDEYGFGDGVKGGMPLAGNGVDRLGCRSDDASCHGDALAWLDW